MDKLNNLRVETIRAYLNSLINGEKKVVFTNSTVLKDQLERYKEHLPFITTIIKPKKYYTFS